MESLVSLMTQQNENLERMQRQMADLRGRGAAAEGKVIVEVNAAGGLSGLHIDPRAMRLSAGQLTEAIMRAATQAARHARDQSEALLQPIVQEMTATNSMMDALPDDEPGSMPVDIDEVVAAVKAARDRMGLL